MAATDIPPSPITLNIAGQRGDMPNGGFNVQSMLWTNTHDPTLNRPPQRSMLITRLVDALSPVFSKAFALNQVVSKDVTFLVVDPAGAEVVSYLLKDSKVDSYSVKAAVGGNERATETVVLNPTQLTITIAATKRATIV